MSSDNSKKRPADLDSTDRLDHDRVTKKRVTKKRVTFGKVNRIRTFDEEEKSMTDYKSEEEAMASPALEYLSDTEVDDEEDTLARAREAKRSYLLSHPVKIAPKPAPPQQTDNFSSSTQQ